MGCETNMKVCSKCLVEKPITEFRDDPKGKDGKSSQCGECHRKRDRDTRAARYRTDAVFTCCRAILKRQEYGTHVCLVKDSSAYRAVAYMLDELGMIKPEYARRYPHALDDIRLGREALRQRKQQEKDAMASARAMASAQKAIEKAQRKKQKQSASASIVLTRKEINEMLYGRIRSSMRKHRRKQGGFGSQIPTSWVVSNRAIEALLGYSLAQMADHIESMFKPRMTWGKVAAGEIHIDHIVPASSFDLSKPEEVVVCYSLANLRPEWANDNIIKSNKREYLL